MLTQIAILPVAIVLATLVLIAIMAVKYYKKIPPNQVAVFTGRGRQKIVRGGAHLMIPVIERMDVMGLEPFKVENTISDVYSKDGVPVNVTALGLVRFGSTDELIQTAVSRWLNVRREEILSTVTEFLAGSMRSIVSQMTIEELNSNRDELTRRILDEATSSYAPIGMELDGLTIQNISDKNGYLDALGQKRIAEVKRDAAIGQADAERETMERQAEAQRLGRTAQAQADAKIAEAEQERDINLAKYAANVERERATAEQAGPLAEAQARREVVVAEAEVARREQEAGIAVEQQRALRAEQAAQADTIVPAEAAKQASILTAEGDKQAAIAAAQAEAEATRVTGTAEADARMAAANARREELAAEASGEQAKLEAQAEGQTKLSQALNGFEPEAIRLLGLQLALEKMPELAAEYARQLGNIDRMVVVQNSGSGDGNGDMISQLMSAAPAGIAALMESIRATTGVNVSEIVSGNGSLSASSPTTSTSTTPTPEVLATPSRDGAVTTE